MNQIALQIAGANLSNQESTDDVGRKLLQQLPESDIYHLEPPTGSIGAGALDWTIISQVADLAGIASALWLVYAEVIRPLKAGKNDDKGLLVVLDLNKDLKWFLGRDFDDRDAFVKDFVTKVSHYQMTDEAGRTFTKTVIETQAADHWVLRK